MVLFEFALLFRRIRGALRKRRIVALIGMVVLVFTIGTLGLHLAQGESYWDSFYWTVVTVTTIGYGDIVPVTFWARILFFFIVFAGIGTFAAALTEVAAYVMEQRVLQMRGLHRARMKEHVIIVGYDETTEELIQQLKDRDVEAIVIQASADTSELYAKGVHAIAGDPYASDTLQRAGIADADAIVIPDAGDEVSVMVALKAKQLNPKVTVIAACAKVEDQDIMSDAKVDVVLPLAKLHGEILASAVFDSKVVDFFLDILDEEKGVVLNEVPVTEPTTVGGLKLRKGERPILIYSGRRAVTDFTDSTHLSPKDLVLTVFKLPDK